MKKYIWIVVAIILGVWMGSALAAPIGGYIPVKTEQGYQIKFPIMNGLGNTTGECNPNGMSEHIVAIFTNTGDDIKSVWIQDGEIWNGLFTNATTVIDVDPLDTDSFKNRQSVLGGPCWRLHSEDSDLGIANKLKGIIKLWAD